MPRRPWTPERLKHALNQHLHGERIAILANREPYIHERGPKDTIGSSIRRAAW